MQYFLSNKINYVNIHVKKLTIGTGLRILSTFSRRLLKREIEEKK